MSNDAMSSISPASDARSPKPSGGIVQFAVDWVADLGGMLMDWLVTLGDFALFCTATMRWLITRMPRRETLLPCCYQIGV